MSETTRNLSTSQIALLERGLARIHQGRLIPVMRGGDETEEERVAREAAEATAAAEAEAARGRMFTPEQQAAVDRIVQERIARVKAEPPADYEDLKAAAARLAEIEASSLSDLEKANARATAAEESAARATATANDRLVQAAVLAQATSQKAIKPEHLHKLIDTAAVTVGDDGQVTGAGEAVKAFLDANPEYVGGTTTTRANGDADQGARKFEGEQLSSVEGMSSAEIAKATAEGRLDSYLSQPN